MCKNMDYEAHVQGQFINHTIIFLPEETFDLPTGCWEKTITKGLPDVMPSGVYYYSETVEYEVNPIRTIKYRFESEEFTVSK